MGLGWVWCGFGCGFSVSLTMDLGRVWPWVQGGLGPGFRVDLAMGLGWASP